MALFEIQPEVECLYSTVRNISTSEKFFGFLPPHGRRLACGEEMTVFGDIQAWLQARLTPQHRGKRSLEAALSGLAPDGTTPAFAVGPVLALVKTPSVHLYNDDLEHTKILYLHDADTLAVEDPCWGEYNSSSIVCVDNSYHLKEAKALAAGLPEKEIVFQHVPGDDATGHEI